MLTGVFASAAWGGTNGLLAGSPRQLGLQALGLVVTALYSGAATFVLIKAIGALFRLRSDGRGEAIGLDVTQHGEEAYTDGEGAVLVMSVTAGEPEPRLVAAVEGIG